MTPTETYYENLAKVTMKSLERRQFECHYCKTAQDAVTLASQLVPAGSTVSFGGSMTFSESGMADTLNQRSDITLLDRKPSGSFDLRAGACDHPGRNEQSMSHTGRSRFPCKKCCFSAECQPSEPEHTLRSHRIMLRLLKPGLHLLPYGHHQKKRACKAD